MDQEQIKAIAQEVEEELRVAADDAELAAEATLLQIRRLRASLVERRRDMPVEQRSALMNAIMQGRA